MPALPATVSPSSADTGSAEVLFCTAVPGGEQEGKPTPLATEVGKPGLLLRRAARESSAGVARETPLSADPLQEMIIGQPIEEARKSGGLALQEMIEPEVCESVEEIGV
jgi:hypothetical protein